MQLTVKTASSLEKILPSNKEFTEVEHGYILKNSHFAFQMTIESDERKIIKMSVCSELNKYLTLYRVENRPLDYTGEGVVPDVLQPIDSFEFPVRAGAGITTILFDFNIPKNAIAGDYSVKTVFSLYEEPFDVISKLETPVTVIDKILPESKIKSTLWFHTDCIASAHEVEIYSEEHWALIDKYMKLYSDIGMNMILTPVITPPLDTAVGIRRPCVQLVQIEKKGKKYYFDFSLLDRWFSLCKKHKIKYFEIAHMFSQWGIKCAPNIRVKEKGVTDFKFGWHVASNAPEYKEFLLQFIPALVEYLKAKKLYSKCYFHISDEPHGEEHLRNYKYASSVVRPLLKGAKFFDAISDIEFFKTKQINIPVVHISSMPKFIEYEMEERWTYYCCTVHESANRFLTIPAYRNRVLGTIMYKHDIEGFLQWGFNFYYSQFSRYEINPYLNSSAGRGFPEGDSFLVYPTAKNVHPSLRAIVFKDALQDITLFKMLEGYIGKDAVIKLIEDEAGAPISFFDYPHENDFYIRLTDKIKKMLAEM